NEAGRVRTNNPAKGCAADIPVDGLRPKELRMVEHIESFHPELEGLRFREAQVLEKSHIEVVQPRSVEETPFRGTWSAQGILAELGRVEVRPPVPRIGVERQSIAVVIRLIHTVVVNAVGFGAKQRIVSVIHESHGKAGAETSDTRKLPILS